MPKRQKLRRRTSAARRKARPARRASMHLTPEVRAAVLREAKIRYPPGNRVGVVGFTVVAKGDEWSLLVLVRSPSGRARPSLPPLDVEVGGATIQVSPRVKPVRPPKPAPPITRLMPAFTGLHPGAALVTGQGQRTGGVACLLGAGAP